MPIHSGMDSLLAVNVSVPTSRMNAARQKQIVSMLRSAVAEIESLLS
jgi:DNA-binding IclR family transcriptional regulator